MTVSTLRFPRWFQPDFVQWEMLLLRGLFALALFFLAEWQTDGRLPDMPVGLQGMGLDFSWTANPAIMKPFKGAATLLMVGYTLGWRLGLMSGLLFLMTIPCGTYRNSSGIRHHDQILSLILLGQSLWHAWVWWRSRCCPMTRIEAQRGHIWAALQVTAAVYVCTGLTKVLQSGLIGWVAQAKNYPIQVRKTNQQAFYDTLTPPTEAARWVENFFADQVILSRLMLFGGLAMELGAVCLLFGRRWAFGVGLALLGFHQLNAHVMSLNFPPHVAVIVIFLILPFFTGLIPRRS
jgi:hypothetical protein